MRKFIIPTTSGHPKMDFYLITWYGVYQPPTAPNPTPQNNPQPSPSTTSYPKKRTFSHPTSVTMPLNADPDPPSPRRVVAADLPDHAWTRVRSPSLPSPDWSERGAMHPNPPANPVPSAVAPRAMLREVSVCWWKQRGETGAGAGARERGKPTGRILDISGCRTVSALPEKRSFWDSGS